MNLDGSSAAAGSGDEKVQVSLVIPVRNEQDSLPKLIESIRRQTVAPSEVIVVDGGSTDESVAVARRLTEGDARFRLIEAGPATPGRGRNTGVAAASNEWIAFTDAGIVLEPAWLERLARVAINDPTVDVVYGNYEPVANSLFERCAALSYVPPKHERPGGLMRGPVVPSSLMRRRVWDQVGGFPDLRAAEDMIFLERVNASGSKVGWAPTATVWWQLPSTLGNTFRRTVLYSRHNVKAGRQRDWHYGVARKYLFAIPFIVLAFAHSLLWLTIPVLGTLARVTKSLWKKREGRGLFWLLHTVHFAGVAVILFTMDVAMFVGWAQSVIRRGGRN